MKVSFDLDDTAWAYRSVFRELAHTLKARGHSVGILTGHGGRIREADLDLWVRRGFPPADFLLNADDCIRAQVPWEHTPQHIWKPALAALHGIAIHVDDYALRLGDKGSGRLEMTLINQPNETDS